MKIEDELKRLAQRLVVSVQYGAEPIRALDRARSILIKVRELKRAKTKSSVIWMRVLDELYTMIGDSD